jgi:hypothetical protein
MKRQITTTDFRCLHCQAIITTAYAFSGVRNRNHCPYCLWSRHLDWREPGDRLSSCKGAMRPIGLTRKITWKKFGGAQAGELMIVHECVECDRISINRIAADDLAETLRDVFFRPPESSGRIPTELLSQGIRLLGQTDWETVSRLLFGVLAEAGSEMGGE